MSHPIVVADRIDMYISQIWRNFWVSSMFPTRTETDIWGGELQDVITFFGLLKFVRGNTFQVTVLREIRLQVSFEGQNGQRAHREDIQQG
jgi:hypothetical protein